MTLIAMNGRPTYVHRVQRFYGPDVVTGADGRPLRGSELVAAFNEEIEKLKARGGCTTIASIVPKGRARTKTNTYSHQWGETPCDECGTLFLKKFSRHRVCAQRKCELARERRRYQSAPKLRDTLGTFPCPYCDTRVKRIQVKQVTCADPKCIGKRKRDINKLKREGK